MSTHQAADTLESCTSSSNCMLCKHFCPETLAITLHLMCGLSASATTSSRNGPGCANLHAKRMQV
jgi:Pyruvate/2-oxoacid:ferredoxin oxidoreductase delta subunit